MLARVIPRDAALVNAPPRCLPDDHQRCGGPGLHDGSGPRRKVWAADRACPDLDEQLAVALERASLRDAAAMVAAATGLPRREVYARALALSGRNRGKA